MYFLFSSVEDSNRFWEKYPKRMGEALIRHDEIISSSIQSNGGTVFKTSGEGIFTCFENPESCADAALHIQQSVQNEKWNLEDELKVRIGIHKGTDYEHALAYLGDCIAAFESLGWGWAHYSLRFTLGPFSGRIRPT